jgi:putative DNA primase/helicase
MATPGGIVDLRTKLLRPAGGLVDFHTKRTSVTPDWSCPTPRFDAFLRWALDDVDRVEYIQRVFGIAALGTVEYQQFPILLGVGSNGKTTITNFMVRVFGDYAATMPAKFLIDSQGDRHPTDIARLRGIRLGISNEVPPTAKFNEELIKTLTGEETLTARFMGKDFFEFRNTATHVMTANHLPTVLVGGRGFWRRIRKIDFHNRIADGQEDKTLVDSILADEAAGIMAWVVDGAAAVLAAGEQSPESVVAATQAYRFEEDALARFCDDQLIPTPAMGAIRDQVYNTYKMWCLREGTQPMPRVKFMLFPHAGDGDKSLWVGMSVAGYRTTQELMEQ